MLLKSYTLHELFILFTCFNNIIVESLYKCCPYKMNSSFTGEDTISRK